ncbi:MAG: hypothetical protein RI922_729 [Bacteroidota bacterium]|jgi:GNAT superfamily N-acetyltransferase
MENLTLKELEIEDVKLLFEWAKEEGWNPGVNDATLCFEAFPSQFIGFFRKQELIAAGSIVNYKGDYGFMGLFIVKKEHRSKGIGKLLWEARKTRLLSQLKPGASIGMDGVKAMQSFYARGGFEICFTDERHVREGQSFLFSPKIQPFQQTETDFHLLSEYDQSCFGFNRTEFLKAWISNKTANTLLFKENGEIHGYAVMRKTFEGFKIGPLFADNEKIAEELYKACLTLGVGEKITIDIPTINSLALKLVQSYCTHISFECARMYFPSMPKNDFSKVFGITTLEFG